MDPTHRALLQSPEFRQLVARRWRISLVLSALLFAVYYGYIVAIALYRDLLARPIAGATTLGIPLGVGVIVASWLLTAAYIVWANRRYDPEVSRLRGRAANAEHPARERMRASPRGPERAGEAAREGARRGVRGGEAPRIK